MDKVNHTAYIALSGGVDSAVAAMLLQQKYQKVVGVSHRHWPESRCCTTECIDRAREQCNNIGIPYFSHDCIVEFAKQIVENFVETYKAGLTPNPCVLCNENIRFSLLLEKHFQSQDINPKKYTFATGHYARVEEKNDHFYLKKGVDPSKDQSYMLYRLGQKELQHVEFPLGEFTKDQVREMAKTWNLKSAKIADSMDVCFVKDRYQDFLKEYTGSLEKVGDFITQEGKKIGQHKGIAYYTRGQRNGLGLHGGPWYVLNNSLEKNQVFIGRKEDLFVSSFVIHNTHWHYKDIKFPFECDVQTRYRNKQQKCKISFIKNNQFHIELEKNTIDVSPGQSAVFYDGDYVVGGGIIKRLSN